MQCQERIALEDNDKDVWICVCGNTPPNDGFYTCDKKGNQVEPTKDSPWDGVLYACGSEGCGWIIDQNWKWSAGIRSRSASIGVSALNGRIE